MNGIQKIKSLIQLNHYVEEQHPDFRCPFCNLPYWDGEKRFVSGCAYCKGDYRIAKDLVSILDNWLKDVDKISIEDLEIVCEYTVSYYHFETARRLSYLRKKSDANS
jgi:hypothetical protein